MKEPEAALAIVLSLSVGVLLAVAAYFTGCETVQRTRQEAVQRGFATWVSDENGNTTFTWKEPTP